MSGALRGKTLVFVLIVLPSALAACSKTEEVTAQTPVVTVVNPEYNFGIVPAYSTLAYEFQFVNDSSKDITYTVGKASCSCLRTSAETLTVPAKGKASLPVEYRASSTGKSKQSLLLTSASDGYKDVFLQVSAEVRPLIALKPESIVLEGPANEPHAEVQRVTATRNFDPASPLTIEGFSSSCSGITASTVRAFSESQDVAVFEIHIKFDSIPVGESQEYLHIAMNGRPKACSLPVLIKGKGPFTLQPSMLTVGILSPGRTCTRRISIDNVEPGWKVGNVRCSKEDITASAQAGDHEIIFELQAKDKAQPGSFDDVLCFSVSLCTPGHDYSCILPIRGAISPSVSPTAS